MKKYYNIPTIVLFLDVFEHNIKNRTYQKGIAYKNDIICLCCGSAYNIEELIELYSEIVSDNSDYAIAHRLVYEIGTSDIFRKMFKSVTESTSVRIKQIYEQNNIKTFPAIQFQAIIPNKAWIDDKARIITISYYNDNDATLYCAYNVLAEIIKNNLASGLINDLQIFLGQSNYAIENISADLTSKTYCYDEVNDLNIRQNGHTAHVEIIATNYI